MSLQRAKEIKLKKDEMKQHLQEIKERNASRLKNMMGCEVQYYKTLDTKLDKMNKQRENLKEIKQDRSIMITGVKPMKIEESADDIRAKERLDRRNYVKKIEYNELTDAEKKAIKEAESKKPTLKKKIKKVSKKNKVVIQNIEIEKPLFTRMKYYNIIHMNSEEYQKKVKEETTKASHHLNKQLLHYKKYQNIDLNHHELIYK